MSLYQEECRNRVHRQTVEHQKKYSGPRGSPFFTLCKCKGSKRLKSRNEESHAVETFFRNTKVWHLHVNTSSDAINIVAIHETRIFFKWSTRIRYYKLRFLHLGIMGIMLLWWMVDITITNDHNQDLFLEISPHMLLPELWYSVVMDISPFV
jgi:hypothetical protein